MIPWNIDETDLLRQVMYFYRNTRGLIKYYDSITPIISPKKFGFRVRPGHQSVIASLRNKYKGQPAVIICNGPSLSSVPTDILKQNLTIGCNGIYMKFPDWGFGTNFLITEDIELTRDRAIELDKVGKVTKMTALYNAYNFPVKSDWIYFNSPRSRGGSYYTKEGCYPQFSRDFASIVHLGSTVTYIMIQLAYHLGSNPVYIVGLDFDWGLLTKEFPVGKLRVNQANHKIISETHFNEGYFKMGNLVGVPDTNRQALAYTEANKIFRSGNRQIFNVSDSSCLNVFPKIPLSTWVTGMRRASPVSPGEVLNLLKGDELTLRKIYFWGAGGMGKRLSASLGDLRFRVHAFLDSDTPILGRRVNGISVRSPTQELTSLTTDEFRPFIFITSSFFQEINDYLISRGFIERLDFIQVRS